MTDGDWTRVGSSPKPCQADLPKEGCRKVADLGSEPSKGIDCLEIGPQWTKNVNPTESIYGIK